MGAPVFRSTDNNDAARAETARAALFIGVETSILPIRDGLTIAYVL
jgi:hypothetical protein